MRFLVFAEDCGPMYCEKCGALQKGYIDRVATRSVWLCALPTVHAKPARFMKCLQREALIAISIVQAIRQCGLERLTGGEHE